MFPWCYYNTAYWLFVQVTYIYVLATWSIHWTTWHIEFWQITEQWDFFTSHNSSIGQWACIVSFYKGKINWPMIVVYLEMDTKQQMYNCSNSVMLINTHILICCAMEERPKSLTNNSLEQPHTFTSSWIKCELTINTMTLSIHGNSWQCLMYWCTVGTLFQWITVDADLLHVAHTFYQAHIVINIKCMTSVNALNKRVCVICITYWFE